MSPRPRFFVWFCSFTMLSTVRFPCLLFGGGCCSNTRLTLCLNQIQQKKSKRFWEVPASYQFCHIQNPKLNGDSPGDEIHLFLSVCITFFPLVEHPWMNPQMAVLEIGWNDVRQLTNTTREMSIHLPTPSSHPITFKNISIDIINLCYVPMKTHSPLLSQSLTHLQNTAQSPKYLFSEQSS